MRRAHVQDAAPFLGFHVGQGEACRMKGRGKVEGEDQVPFGDREFLDGGNKLRARVVHQDIDAAELRDGFGHHGFDGLGLRQVSGREGGSYFMIPFDPGPKRFDFFRVTETVEDHIGTFGSQPGRNRLADPAGRSGNEGGFSLEHVKCLPEARLASG